MLYKVVLPGLLVSLIVTLAACSRAPDTPPFQSSGSLPAFDQNSFSDYVRENRAWLSQNRAFLTENTELELEQNSPFELRPRKPPDKKKGILLVHGLGDSPYSFVDIAPRLAQEGYLVRGILLPGHGSRPADLINISMADWYAAVDHHANLLASEVDELWLGGFSTGANLITSWSLKNENRTKGLLLFSPGFKPRSELVGLSPALSYLKDWADVEISRNTARYDSLAVNGAGEYYKTSKEVRSLLEEYKVEIPALIAISEDDSVINAKAILTLFEQRFTHPDSQLVWYGPQPRSDDSRVTVMDSYIPELNISNFSHMSALFAPENSYYGASGSYRMCDNGQTLQAQEQCPIAETVWYSSWGYREEGKIHARLTWNPYFKDLMDRASSLVR